MMNMLHVCIMAGCIVNDMNAQFLCLWKFAPDLKNVHGV